MLACVDVQYQDPDAAAACCLFRHWADAASSLDLVERVSGVAPYEPGRLYLRELPCLLAVLRRLEALPEVILVDGYVWLDAAHGPGLGAHLYQALAGAVPVIGVAKSCYRQGVLARPVLRGASRRPLFVTAVGLPLEQAADAVLGMHGAFRIPTLLRKVDQLCRAACAPPGPSA